MLYDPSPFSHMSEQERKEVLLPDKEYVDADHAGRSRTGFIVYLNNAPVYCYWYTKRQGSVESESLTYEAGLTAMKETAEYVRSLRYKSRMMGIHVEEAKFIFGDSRSVLANTMNPRSTLKKKSAAIAIAYHLIREGVARGKWITAWISTHNNIADLPTKSMAPGDKRNVCQVKCLSSILKCGVGS